MRWKFHKSHYIHYIMYMWKPIWMKIFTTDKGYQTWKKQENKITGSSSTEALADLHWPNPAAVHRFSFFSSVHCVFGLGSQSLSLAHPLTFFILIRQLNWHYTGSLWHNIIFAIEIHMRMSQSTLNDIEDFSRSFDIRSILDETKQMNKCRTQMRHNAWHSPTTNE